MTTRQRRRAPTPFPSASSSFPAPTPPKIKSRKEQDDFYESLGVSAQLKTRDDIIDNDYEDDFLSAPISTFASSVGTESFPDARSFYGHDVHSRGNRMIHAAVDRPRKPTSQTTPPRHLNFSGHFYRRKKLLPSSLIRRDIVVSNCPLTESVVWSSTNDSTCISKLGGSKDWSPSYPLGLPSPPALRTPVALRSPPVVRSPSLVGSSIIMRSDGRNKVPASSPDLKKAIHDSNSSTTFASFLRKTRRRLACRSKSTFNEDDDSVSEDYRSSPKENQRKRVEPLDARKGDLLRRVHTTKPRPSASKNRASMAKERTSSKMSRITWGEIEEDRVYLKYQAKEGGRLYVNGKDLKTLKRGHLINDSIIDFYLCYLVNDCLPLSSRIHVFSSFFFKRLVSKNNRSIADDLTTSARRHAGVKNWTKDVDVFEKDFLVVPVNRGMHWFLIIVCLKERSRETSSSGDEAIAAPNLFAPVASAPRGSYPCIVIFDSLGAHSGATDYCASVIRSYLEEEFKRKHVGEKAENERDFRTTLPWYSPRLPLQSNGVDCGVFVLHYAQLFLQQPFKDPAGDHRRWFDSADVALKRAEIARLIMDLGGEGGGAARA